MSNTVQSIEERIQEYASKLNTELSQRAKKRILQKLGKLKKELNSAKEHINENSVSQEDNNKRKFSQIEEKEYETGPKLVSKKDQKAKLRLLNQDIAELAKKKYLKQAIKKFRSAQRNEVPLDVHSFSNLINAYVRCNDLVGAESILSEMIKTGINPNFITFTILLKGYSEVGDLKNFSRIYFDNLIHSNSKVNARTLNTYLRGCIRVGATRAAIKGFVSYIDKFKKLLKTSGGDADIDDMIINGSTYEYLISMLCRSNQLEIAESLCLSLLRDSQPPKSTFSEPLHQKIRRLSAGGVEPIENSAIYLWMAKAFTLIGNVPTAKKWLELSLNTLKISESSMLKESMRRRFEELKNEDSFQSMAKGHTTASQKIERVKSVELFLQHRRQEIRREYEFIEEHLNTFSLQYLLSDASQGSSSQSVPPKGKEEGSNPLPNDPSSELVYDAEIETPILDDLTADRMFSVSHSILLMRSLGQLLYFGFDGHTDMEISDLTSPEIARGVEHLCDFVTVPEIVDPSLKHRDKEKLSLAMRRLASIADNNSTIPLSEKLLWALKSKFGFDLDRMILQSLKEDDNSNTRGQVGPIRSDFLLNLNEVLNHEAQFLEAKVQSCLDVNQKLRFDKLFSLPGLEFEDTIHAKECPEQDIGELFLQELEKANRSSLKDALIGLRGGENFEKKFSDIPINIEICSGNGEWIVEKAASDRVIYDLNGAFPTFQEPSDSMARHRSSFQKKSNIVKPKLNAAVASETSSANKNPLGKVKAFWIAMELRCDRVHQILSSHLLNSNDIKKNIAQRIQRGETKLLSQAEPAAINNLAIIGGDASKILPNYFPSGRISNIFISHPQPPEFSGVNDKKNGKSNQLQGSHLLTESFFRELSRVLKVGGHITIISDNLAYMELLGKILQESFLHESTDTSTSRACLSSDVSILEEGYEVHKEFLMSDSNGRARKILILKGDPRSDPYSRGGSSSSTSQTTSYFDRMWDLGQKKKRWFFFLQKE